MKKIKQTWIRWKPWKQNINENTWKHKHISDKKTPKPTPTSVGGGRKCQKRHKKHLETSHVFQFFLFYLLGFGTGDNLHLVLMEKNISFFCPFLRNEENMQKALKKYTGTKQMKQHVHMWKKIGNWQIFKFIFFFEYCCEKCLCLFVFW